MKTLKTFILLLAVTLTIPSICACGDDDDNSPIVGPGGNSGKNNKPGLILKYKIFLEVIRR